jgi:hypothetical protein
MLQECFSASFLSRKDFGFRALGDRFYDTSLGLTYGANYNNMSWNFDLGFQNQIYNWYGLQSFGATLTPNRSICLLFGIDPQHSTIHFLRELKLSSMMEF